MARGWRVLDITSLVGNVSTRRGQLAITPEGEESSYVPVADLALVLLGQKVALSGGVVHYLAQHDVSALMCDWRGVPYAGFHSWSEHTRVGARHLAQVDLTKPRQKNAWMQIVKAKVLGQAQTLALVDRRAARRLFQLAADVRSGDPNNSEAIAARWYWRHLFANQRFSRDQDGRDNLNSMLNYGYAILRGFGIRAVAGAGLSPTIGVFHRNRSNPFNLVEDLIEPFRPVVDAAVHHLGTDASLKDHRVKQALVSVIAKPFDPTGMGVGSMLDDLAQQFGKYAEGDMPRLDVPSWNPIPDWWEADAEG